MISTQEIKEALKEITHEPNEKYIEKIQSVFEFNPWLLEKLTDEQLRIDYIKLLYNYEDIHRGLIKYSRESETLGKMVLGIILKYSKKNYPSEIKSDSEIFNLLSGTDWKEKSEFYVIGKQEVGWKEVHNYRAKPQNIVENHYRRQEEKHEERLAEKERKIKALEKIMFKEEKEDVSNQFSLLSRLYRDEVEKSKNLIKYYTEYQEKNDSGGFEDEIKKLEKELGEKEILVKKLEIKEKIVKLKEEIKNLEGENSQLVAQQQQEPK